MNLSRKSNLAPYRRSLPGLLLAARETVMGPLRPVLRDSNVTEQQWRILRVLDDQGSLDAQTLAAAALLSAPSVSRILRELLDRGLIERLIDSADGRRSIVSISASGSELVQAVSDKAIEILGVYRDLFGEARLRLLMEELEQLSSAIANYSVPK